MHAHDVLSAAATPLNLLVQRLLSRTHWHCGFDEPVVRRPSVRAGVGLVPSSSMQKLGVPNVTTLYKPAITGMQSQSQWNSQPPRDELVLCYMADTPWMSGSYPPATWNVGMVLPLHTALFEYFLA